MNDTETGPQQAADPTTRWGLWPWFIAGFVVVFLGMSVAVTMHSMLPSGRGVVGLPLWRYYIVELGRALTSSGGLGPSSRSGTAALTTAFQHLLCSTVGGTVTAGVAWAVKRLRKRPNNAA